MILFWNSNKNSTVINKLVFARGVSSLIRAMRYASLSQSGAFPVSVTYFVDPKDRKKSLMMRQQPLCSGAQTGFKCKHYWSTITKLDVLNPLSLKQGEKTRRCLVIAPEIIELGDGGQEQAVFCDRYIPDQDRPYDRSFERGYKPLTQAEIDELDAIEVDDAYDDEDAGIDSPARVVPESDES